MYGELSFYNLDLDLLSKKIRGLKIKNGQKSDQKKGGRFREKLKNGKNM
ncbi:MAG: hypothetical protein IKI90_08505 [Treponema sp.]|nr:hypothetical protein [Treponema sp.]